MKIRNKLFFVIIAVAAINLFFFVSISFLNTRDFLRTSIYKDLDHVAEARKLEVESFFENIEKDLIIAQGYYNFKKNLPVVSRLLGDKSNQNYITSKQELDAQMSVLQGVKKFRNIILLNQAGQVVYFSDANMAGEYQEIVSSHIQDAFEAGKSGVYLSDPLKGISVGQVQGYFMLAAAPIYDNKKFIGEVVFEVGLDDLFSSIQNAVALGKTGEVVIGKKINDKEILILNPLRYDPGAALNKKILIGGSLGQGIQQAIRDIKGIGIITDYNGTESLASWHQIPMMRWGLVVKINTQEAFAPINELVKILALLIVIEASVVLLFIFFVAKSITDSLVKLHKGMEVIAAGDLNYRVGTTNKDEVGQLSRSFDEMIEKLKEAQFKYFDLIETTPLCIKVFDSTGKLIFMNKGGRDEHFIKENQDLTNWDWLDTITEPYRKNAKEKFDRALKGEGGTIEFQHTPSGSKHEWCSGVLSPVKDSSGKVKTVLFYSTDITAIRNATIDLERKVAERTAEINSEREKFSLLIERLPVGVIMISATDGSPINLNKKGEEILGKSAHQLVGKGPFFKVIDFIKEDGSPYPQGELPMSMALKNGEPASKEDLYVKRQDGSVIACRGMAVPFKDDSGKIIYGIGVLEDISKEKRVEKMRVDFLSLASHQLRTPLSGTKWLVETLKMEKFGTLNPKQRQYLDELEHVNDRMIKLVFDMLNALRFESGSLEIKKERVQASSIVEDIVKTLDPAAKKKNVVIESLPPLSGDTIIETDVSLIKTVLEALISNAIEYSKSGQKVLLSITKESKGVTFMVKDFGIGIPDDEKVRIMEKFYRASNAKTNKPDGTGLGLYIASLLAERIEGKLTFESKENEGSSFYFTVPKKLAEKK